MTQMIQKPWNVNKLDRLLRETLERGTISKTSTSRVTKICARPIKNSLRVEVTTLKNKKRLPQKVMS